MSARSSTMPADVKTRIEAGSKWSKYPMIFAGVGIISLCLAFAISAFTYDPEGHASAPAENAQHQESGEGHGGEASGAKPAGHTGGKSDGESGEAGHAEGSEAGHAESGEAGHAEGGGHGHSSPRFWFSYLTAYMYGLSIALGGLFFVIIQFLVRAGWSVVVRRIAENIMGTLPLFALLFVPVAFGLPHTHSHWWGYEPGTDVILDGKLSYLNAGFFFVRAVVYLGVWSILSRIFLKSSIEQDESGDHDITRKLQGLSPVALILFALTLTFAAIDWMKSMDPHWYSTMWGVYYFAGGLVGIFASLAILVLWLQRDGYIREVVNVEHYHDIGKLLFGFVVFWTYIAFSQYFLIWYANLPEEQLWYAHRAHGGWGAVGKALIVGHFFIPFFFLLPRGIKRNPITLFIGAVWMLIIHYVDLYFVVMPVHSETFSPSFVDLFALIGVMGIFLAGFAFLAGRSDLIPRRDPRLPESLGFENF